MTPQRIQRQRTNGWRMPANTVYVGRPTRWGNPFAESQCVNREQALTLFRALTQRDYRTLREMPWTAALALARGGGYRTKRELMRLLAPLRGKNLACWCRLDQECHADVLLELANAEDGR